MLALRLRTDKRMGSFEKRMDGFEARMGAFEVRVVEELAGLRSELRALGERVARLEGLIEGSGLFRRPELSEGAGD